MNLKKMMFGLAALLLVFGLVINLSAFKSNKKRAIYTFSYNGPDYLKSSVTNPNNWQYDPADNLCSSEKGKACTIQVDASFVNSSTHTLKPSINLTAATATNPNIAYVTGSADIEMGIYNESNN